MTEAEITYRQWDWTKPATLTQQAISKRDGISIMGLAKRRDRGTGRAFVKLGERTILYWDDHRTREEQLAYLRSLAAEVAS